MNDQLEVPRTHRKRRSHAERTAETRGRIKAAVIEAISDLGFHRTTAAEISRRAGVSWGAAQHHFGDKDGILTAVLVDSFNRFAERLASIPVENLSLAERVALFVDTAWEHFGSAHYRCTLEILLNMPAPDWVSRELPLRDATLEAWSGIWGRFFGEANLSPRSGCGPVLHDLCSVGPRRNEEIRGAHSGEAPDRAALSQRDPHSRTRPQQSLKSGGRWCDLEKGLQHRGLAARVQALERELLPEAIGMIAVGRVQIAAGRTRILPDDSLQRNG